MHVHVRVVSPLEPLVVMVGEIPPDGVTVNDATPAEARASMVTTMVSPFPDALKLTNGHFAPGSVIVMTRSFMGRAIS